MSEAEAVPSRAESACRVASYVLAAAGLLLVFLFHLVPALVAGLLVHAILVAATVRLHGRLLSRGAARLVAALLLGTVAALLTVLVVLGVRGFLRGHVGGLPELFSQMAGVLSQTKAHLAAGGVETPFLDQLVDGEELQARAAEWLKVHGGELGHASGQAGKGLLHAVMGIAVGLLVFFARDDEDGRAGPLAREMSARVARFATSFRAVLKAQVEISAINTTLTAVYLFGVVPLATGGRLPLSGTLVAVTFLAGLLPVVGNLLSNTAIVVLSLGVSPWLALGSLGFLVGVHKLEYLINAKLVGHRVHAAAWEILLAIVVFEVAFGVPGVVLAPVAWAWAKAELEAEGLV